MEHLARHGHPHGHGQRGRLRREANHLQCVRRADGADDSHERYAAFVAVATDGASTITFFATDNAGNNETPQSFTIHLDQAAPHIIGRRSPDPNAYDWNNSAVTVSFPCSDALSGLAS